ncbi:MAG TPA: aldehyde dehydrogenase (NADP(+)) [Sphingobium sp.]|nr:aldehyde dehydrogenase (NADP(+)) [Sphingobium sp.]
MTEFRSIIAETGTPYGDPIPTHGPEDVAIACRAADTAFDSYRATSRQDRATFLERCGDEIMALGDVLIETAMRESGLPRPRLEGERGRTVGQFKMFAEVVRAGLWQQLRIDPALPDRKPAPRPDLRLRMIPVGPVAVFGASNFPLAFSTGGGDTASALAAGCPVVVKGHPAHPMTAALVAQAISKAVEACNLPAGVFSQLVGPSHELGAALVQDPHIAAVGFTGSRAGGLALVRLAQARAVPIPVHAEMSSINPVLLLPAALESRGASIGTAFVASLTMGAGQFCTNPGLIIAMESEGLDAFISSAATGVSAAPSQTMLTAGIHNAFVNGTAAFASHRDVETLATGDTGDGTRGGAILFQTSAKAFLADPHLANEVFGASAIVVRCSGEADMLALIAQLEGQLTATLHMDAADEPLAARLLPLLERKAGRILANGWPTGVEVSHAMVHGGPFPATSDSRTTSVGSLAINRFLRPVSYQNFATSLLPEALRDTALGDGSPRLIDGKLTLDG